MQLLLQIQLPFPLSPWFMIYQMSYCIIYKKYIFFFCIEQLWSLWDAENQCIQRCEPVELGRNWLFKKPCFYYYVFILDDKLCVFIDSKCKVVNLCTRLYGNWKVNTRFLLYKYSVETHNSTILNVHYTLLALLIKLTLVNYTLRCEFCLKLKSRLQKVAEFDSNFQT